MSDPTFTFGAEIRDAFQRSRETDLTRFVVKLRRRRAEELRTVFTRPDQLDVATFNRDVWAIESETVLRSEGTRLRLVSSDDLDPGVVARAASALDADDLELHGNYVWRPASSIYDPHLKDDAEKLENIQAALLLLTDPQLDPVETARQLSDIRGFGDNTATGLVMLCHSDRFAIYNAQSKAALALLGIPADSLDDFQVAADRLRRHVGAEDFLELDWFLYRVAQGHIAFVTQPTVWLFQANPDLYDLAAELKAISIGDEDDWVVTRYRQDMHPRDKVLLWQGGRAAGIYAVGEITGPPFERLPADFWPDSDRRSATEWAIPFRYTNILGEPLEKGVLQQHAVLRTLQVLRSPQGTNFRVTLDEWKALQDLFEEPDAPGSVRFWVEKTQVRGSAYREAGEFAVGHALVAPTSSTSGADVFHTLRRVQPGDVIVHLTDSSSITGLSRVATPAEEMESFAEYDASQTHRTNIVRLRDWRALDPPLHRDTLFGLPFRDRLVGLLESGARNLFYAGKTNPHLTSSGYLTEAPRELVAVLADAYRDASDKDLLPYDWEVPDIGRLEPRCWIEKTIVRGRPDRQTGEYALGRALWSPQRDKRGADVYRFMRDVRTGDVVLHLTDNEGITGLSRAAASVEEFDGVANTEWGETPSYLVRLRNHVELAPPLPRGHFFSPPYRNRLVQLIDGGTRNLFYNREPSLNQGAYLTPAPPELVQILNDAYRALAGRDLVPFREQAPDPSTIGDVMRSTHLDRAEIEELVDLLEEKRQIILEGPPGSGKTWVADKLARYLTGNPLDGDTDERVELVQFHQSYGYEDFVQGIRPVTDERGALQYRVLPGIFARLCTLAERNPTKRFVLIIDEINRGNISRIFGELLLLLEYRDRRVRLPFGSGDGTSEEAYLAIPDNLLIIGTMNSTDRSLALIDYALRRRFFFYRLMPVVEGRAPVLARWLDRNLAPSSERERVLRLFVALNEKIQTLLPSDYQVGHSYFMSARIDTPSGLGRVWRRAVTPLLEEYFHGVRDRTKTMAGFTVEALLAVDPLPDASLDDG